MNLIPLPTPIRTTRRKNWLLTFTSFTKLPARKNRLMRHYVTLTLPRCGRCIVHPMRHRMGPVSLPTTLPEITLYVSIKMRMSKLVVPFEVMWLVSWTTALQTLPWMRFTIYYTKQTVNKATIIVVSIVVVGNRIMTLLLLSNQIKQIVIISR